ncbi:MAG: fibro-slime domain-containing protein [Kofleriaceae bacterium]|nr:fibro-slime domain-containing protein [Kofleriaceae bacterium]
MSTTSFARASLLLFLVACGDDGGSGNLDGGSDDDGGGNEDSNIDNGDGGSGQCGTLRAVIRDFKIDHPDFEVVPANDVVIPGLVMSTMTPGGKPMLAANPPAAGLITSATTFAQWYTDVTDVNQRFEQDLVLTETSPGNFVYDDDSYFPIDGMGFGNENNPHNYHFTTELHANFTYKGGEVFTFRGDDDVWVFVNGKLAIDIGGVHSANSATIDFDARAAELGLTVNQTYAIDFFQAERHVTGSNFRIETSIACFVIF